MRFGTTVTTELTLHNDSQMATCYELSEKLPANKSDVSYSGYLSVILVVQYVFYLTSLISTVARARCK